MKKRNRSHYIVYFEPWVPGMHKKVHSKWQAKKLLWKESTLPGSEFIKIRSTWDHRGWNSVASDNECLAWVKN